MAIRTTRLRALALIALALGLTACQQERNTTASAPAGLAVAPAAEKAMTSSEWGPTLSRDPSLPSASTALAPKEGRADAAYTALSKAEREKAMPLPGQANNYSSDAFAKRGDEAVPRTSSSVEPGSEALATPNSSSKEPQ